MGPDMFSERNVQGVDYHWLGTYGATGIVEEGINHVLSR